MVQPTTPAPQANPLALVAAGVPNGTVALNNTDAKTMITAAEAIASGHHVLVSTLAAANVSALKKVTEVHDASMALATKTAEQSHLQVKAFTELAMHNMGEKTIEEKAQVLNLIAGGTKLLMVQAGDGYKHMHDTVLVPIAEKALENSNEIMKNALSAHQGVVNSADEEWKQKIARQNTERVNALRLQIESEKEAIYRARERIENEIMQAKGKEEVKSLAEKIKRENYQQALESLKIHMAQYEKDVEKAYGQFGKKGSMHLQTTEPKIVDHGNGTYSVTPGHVSWQKRG